MALKLPWFGNRIHRETLMYETEEQGGTRYHFAFADPFGLPLCLGWAG